MKKSLLVLLAVLALGSLMGQENHQNIVINKAFPDETVPGTRVLETSPMQAIPLPTPSIQKAAATPQPESGKSATKRRILGPGESIILEVEGDNVTEDTAHLGITFTPAIEEAIARVPGWLQFDLRFKFKTITSTTLRNKMVQVLMSSPKQYLDEVAYMVAYLPVEVLSYSRLPDDWSYMVTDIERIYTYADSLKYVNLVEYGDTTSGDWYTTTTYKIKQGSSYVWREIDKYYYYQFIVMPKAEQEYVAITDNLTSITGYRTWGYFWRDYLWNNYQHAVNTADTEYRGYDQVNSWGYVAINSSGARDTVRIDTIPRLGQIMQMPEYLWNEAATVYFFNRDFLPTNSALDVLGNWASRCVPQDVTSESDYRPSEPNHIAWKHVGNCHEDAILVTAAARTALIPCIHVADLCDDHVWAAINDGDSVWHHFEFFRGGLSAGRPYYWGMTNMQADGSYGWKSSLVQGYVPDGRLLNMSAMYSDNTPCTLNINVTDPDGEPVDGARVHIYSTNTQYGTEYKLSAGYLWTDAQGKIHAKVGNGKKYYMRIDHPAFGSYPSSSTSSIYTLVSNNAPAGTNYNLNYAFPDAANTVRHNITSTQQQYEASKSLQLTMNTQNITTGANPEDVQSSTFYERTGTPSDLSVYAVAENDLAAFRSGSRTASVEYDFGTRSGGTFSFPVHQNGVSYIVLTNNNNFGNYVEVSFDAEIVDGGDFPISVDEHISMNSAMQAYPNPAASVLHITVTEDQVGNMLEIMDMTGRQVYAERVSDMEENVNIQHLAPGIYVVRCGALMQKFVKE